MSHHLNIESILEKLILLEHFKFGSSDYCKIRLPGSDEDQGDEEYDEYWGWVKSIISNYTIECAVKFRVIQDTIYDKDDIVKFDDLDLFACKSVELGKIVKGSFNLSLRESCNKLIHAKKVVPIWETSSKKDGEFKYWSGSLTLNGCHGKQEWELVLHIGSWAQAMQRFIREFERSDASHYIGQDWY